MHIRCENVHWCGDVKVSEQPLFTSWFGFISVIPSEIQENVAEPPEKPGKCENVFILVEVDRYRVV